MDSDSIGRAFQRITKRAGIEGLHFHDLQHEATSRSFEKGLNPMQVAAITGHKTLQMLKRCHKWTVRVFSVNVWVMQD